MGPRDTSVDSVDRGSHPHDQNSGSSSDTATPPPNSSTTQQSTSATTSTSPLLPSWLQKTLAKTPSPIKCPAKATARWVKGPNPPRVWKINPLFPKIQTIPIKLMDRYLPKRMQRVWLLMAFYFCFLLCFITLINQSQYTREIPGFGDPQVLQCENSFFSPKNDCGLQGDDCRPFQNSTLPFRCNANCGPTMVLNPRAVGAQEINYRPLVIGGPSDTSNSVGSAVYRGDSFICSAAIHSGFLSNSQGGCGVISLVGEQNNYPSIKQHDIDSIAFDSNFPLSFQFVQGSQVNCKDLRWPTVAVTVVFSVLLSLFTTSPSVYFFSLFTMLFWLDALVSDPPALTTYYDLVSSAIGRYLPAIFVAMVYYRYCIRRTLHGLTAQIEKTILWLGPCWVGIMDNYTFDKLPIQRLTPHDIKQQPGGFAALIIIIVIIVIVVIGQVWAIRLEGTLPRFLALYATIGFCLVLMLAIPGLSLRIHHYILGMLLIPGTALQTRPSLVYQGLLLGLFINGISRWGFDALLQTPGTLQGDAQLGSSLPIIRDPAIETNNITFTWETIPTEYDGISILVNDVERYRGFVYDSSSNYTWTRHALPGDPEYFRFGYMSGASAADYTRAGTWQADGSWKPMAPGPS